MLKKLLFLLALSLLSVSCGEEVLTQSTLSDSEKFQDVETYNLNSCANMRFVKPPVDILFVVDNSGSTLKSSFDQIKSQIAATASTISSEFDYHIYIAPLMKQESEDITKFPLVVYSKDGVDPHSSFIRLQDINSTTFFAPATGGGAEKGFQRVHDLIDGNRANGIFREEANTIAVMISNGDDTESLYYASGANTGVFSRELFDNKKDQLENLATEKLNADSFRFISLVPHSNCNGWRTYGNYRRMSTEIHGPSDSKDLCSGNYSELFSAVNNSIRQQIQGFQYDWWKISTASAIQEDEISITKIKEDGSSVTIPRLTEAQAQPGANGYIYRGFKTNQDTRYGPTPDPGAGEAATGLMIQLYGDAKVTYPECIMAKTESPVEYFGYAVLPREPQLGTVKIEINGSTVPNGGANGWSYSGYLVDQNIKVAGPENVSTDPPVKKTGYFIKLNGTSIISNGDQVEVFYKPKAI